MGAPERHNGSPACRRKPKQSMMGVNRMPSGKRGRAERSLCILDYGSNSQKDRPLTVRPTLEIVSAEAEAAVQAFAAGLQAAHDRRDAEQLNRQFASDVIWGSPYGALVRGYDRLHPIHVRFQQQPKKGPAFRYHVRHVLAVSENVVIAHIARLALSPAGEPLSPSFDPDQPFSEMAMYVLVRRNGEWWLAAGQNTPMRPGGAVPATT
jgi:uncharacterized protein (TIGR02246 family)